MALFGVGLGSIIAVIIIFIGVRYIFQDWLLKKFNSELIEKVEQKGFNYVFEAENFPLCSNKFRQYFGWFKLHPF